MRAVQRRRAIDGIVGTILLASLVACSRPSPDREQTLTPAQRKRAAEVGALLQAGKAREAFPLAQRLVAEAPRAALPWRHLALAHSSLGDWAGAEQALTRCLETDAKYGSSMDAKARANIRGTRGLARLMLGRGLAAAADARLALQLDPDEEAALRILVVTSLWTDRGAEAKVYAERLVKADGTAEIHRWLAEQYTAAGDDAAAAEAMDRHRAASAPPAPATPAAPAAPAP